MYVCANRCKFVFVFCSLSMREIVEFSAIRFTLSRCYGPACVRKRLGPRYVNIVKDTSDAVAGARLTLYVGIRASPFLMRFVSRSDVFSSVLDFTPGKRFSALGLGKLGELARGRRRRYFAAGLSNYRRAARRSRTRNGAREQIACKNRLCVYACSFWQ